jgi:hydroxymethylglutaryl-CoA reductase (NADPH)
LSDQQVPLRLVPRYQNQGYDQESIGRRRAWVEEKTGARLERVGAVPVDGEKMRGNIENPIGAVSMPLGLAGPLHVRGEAADGVFYVPLATTEGALVRSYERGMAMITRAGGAEVRIWADENKVSPIFHLTGVAEAFDFAEGLRRDFPRIKEAAEATTRHGKLLRLDCQPAGRKVIVDLQFHTADAHGMNMVVKAADAACRYILEAHGGERYLVFSGYESEKHASGALLRGGKGKKVVAGCTLKASLLRAMLRVGPAELAELWQQTVLGQLSAGTLGYNGHYANGLTALFIATGQDVANVVNSAIGVTHFEVTPDGDLWASVTLPSLVVATVGGGTALGTSRECLEMLGCFGAGKARKLAEIVAATLLAGELSIAGAIASGEMVAAHETYGRNRPGQDQDKDPSPCPLPADGEGVNPINGGASPLQLPARREPEGGTPSIKELPPSPVCGRGGQGGEVPSDAAAREGNGQP